MSKIKVQAIDQNIAFKSLPKIYSGDINTDYIQFEFDETWRDYTKTAVFYRTVDKPYFQVVKGDECVIPHEVLLDEGKFYLGVVGVLDNKVYTTEVIAYEIGKGATTPIGEIVPEPSPELYQQILNELKKIGALSEETKKEQVEFIKNQKTAFTNLEKEVKSEIDKYNTIQLQQGEQISSIKLRLVATSGSLYDPNMNKQSYFWDEEIKKGTLAQQTNDDTWYYQVQSKANSEWVNLPPTAFNGVTWMQNGSSQSPTYHYAKLGRNEITGTLGGTEGGKYKALAYTWKAPHDGYFKMKLETPIGEASNQLAGFVKYSADNTDGESLWSDSYTKGKRIDSRIAKMRKGEFLRIGAVGKNAWVQGFYPMVVEVSKTDYEEQQTSQG